MRRIGILLPAAADDPGFQAWVGAFQQALALLGWTIAEIRRHAAELVALAPDVLVAGSGTATTCESA